MFTSLKYLLKYDKTKKNLGGLHFAHPWVWGNQRNYNKNKITCSKRTLKKVSKDHISVSTFKMHCNAEMNVYSVSVNVA